MARSGIIAPIHVRCHACGQPYDASDKTASDRHGSHGGDSGFSRKTLLAIIDRLQAERDEALRARPT